MLVHNFLLEAEPFRLGIDEITSATIYMKLKDDNGRDGGGDEQFSFLLGNGESFGGANLDTNGAEFMHTLLDLTGLNLSGMMDVSVTALDGAFQSSLQALWFR